jgi:hypothetical protein
MIFILNVKKTDKTSNLFNFWSLHNVIRGLHNVISYALKRLF